MLRPAEHWHVGINERGTAGLGGHHRTVRIAIAALLALLPSALAVGFVKATSSPQDANVGGALYLALGLVVGVTLATVYLRRSSRD